MRIAEDKEAEGEDHHGGKGDETACFRFRKGGVRNEKKKWEQKKKSLGDRDSQAI